MPNGRCYRHGGATPVGPASPHFKHGRHSLLFKDLPRLGAHYARALADPDLLRLDAEIALVDARVSELIMRLQESGQAQADDLAVTVLTTLDEEWGIDGWKDAGKSQQAEAYAIVSRVLAEKVIARAELDAMWAQLEPVIDQRRKLVDTESKRLKDLHAMVSLDRVMALVAYVTDTVRRHVTDRAMAAAVYADLRKMLKPAEGAE